MKNSAPLVSIVTPSFNRLPFLKKCLHSVRSQTYNNIEHIVIDGASTDGTVDFLQAESQKGRLRFVSEPDAGMYDAINKGLRMANGDIVAYLNTDDRYFPWSIETALEALDDASTDLVFGDLCVVVCDQDSTKWYLQFYRDFSAHYYTNFGTIAQPTVFMKRRVLDSIGGFGNGFKLIADCDYWLRCAEAGLRLRHIDEVLALQIDHPGTLRETRLKELQSEFARLRQIHATGRAPTPTWKRIVTSLVSRSRKLSFLAAARDGNGAHWPHIRATLLDERNSVDILETLTNLAKVALPGRVARSIEPRFDLLDGDRLHPSLEVFGK